MAEGDAGIVVGWLAILVFIGLSIYVATMWGRVARFLLAPLVVVVAIIVFLAWRSRDHS